MHKYSEVDIKDMLGFMIDNMFVVFGNKIFQQTVGIPMGTKSAPLLADLFLYSYEAEFIKKNFYLRRMNLLLWPSIQHLDISTMFYPSTTIGSIHMSILYTPSELEIKDITESSSSASYLDVLLNIDAGGKLTTQLYDKLDDFNFAIVPVATSHYHVHMAYICISTD
jgi:hypothetical protein